VGGWETSGARARTWGRSRRRGLKVVRSPSREVVASSMEIVEAKCGGICGRPTRKLPDTRREVRGCTPPLLLRPRRCNPARRRAYRAERFPYERSNGAESLPSRSNTATATAPLWINRRKGPHEHGWTRDEARVRNCRVFACFTSGGCVAMYEYVARFVRLRVVVVRGLVAMVVLDFPLNWGWGWHSGGIEIAPNSSPGKKSLIASSSVLEPLILESSKKLGSSK